MTIQAHFKSPRNSRNQRRDARRKIQLDAVGRSASGRSSAVSIHNLSSTGLLMQTDAHLAEGEVIEVELPRTGIKSLEVVWNNKPYFGCRFLTPIPPAAVSAALLKSSPDTPASATTATDFDGGTARLGQRLTELRTARGWSLDALADRLGVSRQAVWYWETGQRLPRGVHFKQIAETFGVDERELLVTNTPSRKSDGSLLAELKRELARRHGVAEENIRVSIEL